MDAFLEFLSLEEFGVHNMRDHPWHGVAFLAGLWAAKLFQHSIRDKMRESMINILKDEEFAFADRKKKGPDATILEK